MFNNTTNFSTTIERKAIEMNQLLNRLKQKLEVAKTSKVEEFNYMNIIEELKEKIIEIERENKELKKDVFEERKTFYFLNDLRNENLKLKEEIKNLKEENQKCTVNSIEIDELHKKYLLLLQEKESRPFDKTLKCIRQDEIDNRVCVDDAKLYHVKKQDNIKALENELNEANKRITFLSENQQNLINELQKSIEKHKKEIKELESFLKMKLKEEKMNYEELNKIKESEIKNCKNEIKNCKNEIQNYKNEIKNCKNEIKNYKNNCEELKLNCKILENEIINLKGKIRIFCRIKPLKENCKFNFLLTENKICIDKNYFEVNKIFYNENQKQIFNEVSFLIQSLFDGCNATIFAYGQTGSGKTYTMEGCNNQGSDQGFDKGADIKDQGIIPQSINQVFDIVNNNNEFTYNIQIEFIEIYNENIIDLLAESHSSAQNHTFANTHANTHAYTHAHIYANTHAHTHTSMQALERQAQNNVQSVQSSKIEIIHENNKTYLKNTKSVLVKTKDEALNLFLNAVNKRKVGQTNCNERSSRSHSIFRLNLNMHNENETRNSVLCLIDLAGSERLVESGSSGLRLKETQNINKSLSALGNVINSIAKKEKHIPFRDSKLTYFLQNSLGGNSRILMFVNVSAELNHINETLCSLRFAQKVSECTLGSAQKNIQKRL